MTKSFSTFQRIVATSTIGAALIGAAYAVVNPVDSVVPLPANVKSLEGAFALQNGVTISGKSAEVGKLAKQLKDTYGIELKQVEKGGAILLTLDPKAETGEEGYTLKVTKGGIALTAADETGLFYGAQTLVQMVDEKDKKFSIPAADISDAPRFAWRGLMLDESRHFFGKDAVKLLLDNMAARKMNRFHWHLTDDEGWRVEVKGYPKLTEIGAWRGEGTPMPRVKWRKAEDGKGPKYGGFYTQEDLKEIVAYAKERHIDIIPEIDMPGHVTGLVTAYPEFHPNMDEETLSEARKKNPDLPTLAESGDSARAYRKNVMSVVNPKTYEFCEALFDQLTAIFPYKYWHIGGDEVHTLHWEASPEHQALMKEKGFEDPFQLQSMFLTKMSNMLRDRGRIMIGWNEIMKGGGLSKDTAVMGWLGNGPGINAAKQGYPTIMANSPYNYFDMIYPGKGERTGHSWAGPIDSKKSYHWDPVFPDNLNAEEQKNVIGVHACVWAEYVPDAKDMSYKFWPRAASVAEVGWTPQEKRNWDDFKERLGKNLSFFDKNGTFYRVAPPTVTESKGKVYVEPTFESLETKFTLDGSDPIENGKVFNGEVFDMKEAKQLKVATISGNGTPSIVVDEATRPVLLKARVNKQKELTVKADASKTLDEAGEWTVFVKRIKGKTPTMIKSVKVLENGQEIASSTEEVKLEGGKLGSPVKVKVPTVKKEARYEFAITLVPEHQKNNFAAIVEVTADKLVK